MYDNLVSRLRGYAEIERFLLPHSDNGTAALMDEAADAVEELIAKVDILQFFADNIAKLPDCNACLKKNLCEFVPQYGEYCRINCHEWIGAQSDGKKYADIDDPEYMASDCRPDWCPIAPVPPHGDLIDRDALITALQELFDRRNEDAKFAGFRGVSVSWNDAICCIKDAPTIIPAEEGE